LEERKKVGVLEEGIYRSGRWCERGCEVRDVGENWKVRRESYRQLRGTERMEELEVEGPWLQ
jgi:hypothetical protein